MPVCFQVVVFFLHIYLDRLMILGQTKVNTCRLLWSDCMYPNVVMRWGAHIPTQSFIFLHSNVEDTVCFPLERLLDDAGLQKRQAQELKFCPPIDWFVSATLFERRSIGQL